MLKTLLDRLGRLFAALHNLQQVFDVELVTSMRRIYAVYRRRNLPLKNPPALHHFLRKKMNTSILAGLFFFSFFWEFPGEISHVSLFLSKYLLNK